MEETVNASAQRPAGPEAQRFQDMLSLVAVRVESFFGDTPLTAATGFFIRRRDLLLFITNWHVVTGRHNVSLQLSHTKRAEPDRLVVHVPLIHQSAESGGRFGGWAPLSINLYSDSEHRSPRWLEHPIHGRAVDVVAIPTPEFDKIVAFTADGPNLRLEALKIYPSLDVFLLGFPRGFSAPGAIAIWKRGTIASEPQLEPDGLPKIYVDSATRDGLSGAPAYAQEVGSWTPPGFPGDDVFNMSFGKARMFLGVYSARVAPADDAFQAQIGIVWKARVIDEIAAGGQLGTSFFGS